MRAQVITITREEAAINLNVTIPAFEEMLKVK